MKLILSVLFLSLVIAGAVWTTRYWIRREQTLARWQQGENGAETTPNVTSPRGWLSNWLYLAGFRKPYAAAAFTVVTCIFGLLGFGAATLILLSGVQAVMERAVVTIPGGVGETFLPVIWVAPWLTAILMVSFPMMVVRSERRRRVAKIEQDLPLAMELMATLSEAGLGFDSALMKILKTRLAGRPLAEEFQIYQADLLSGRARIESLRRLSARMRISSISILVSALVQAEQMGMGIAKVLRMQADDIRGRRRERAIAFANALPVKRLFPLVICFLPGLFVWTLGPAFVQLFRLTETFTRGG